MRRILVIMAIALVASFGAVLVAEEDSATEKAAAATPAKASAPVNKTAAEPDHASCASGAVSDLEFIEGLKEGARLQSVANPPCPPELDCGGGAQECGGNAPCGATLSRYDLGWDHCDDNGQLFECPPGETIHVDTGRCKLCPCCFGDPIACGCPTDSRFRCTPN